MAVFSQQPLKKFFFVRQSAPPPPQESKCKNAQFLQWILKDDYVYFQKITESSFLGNYFIVENLGFLHVMLPPQYCVTGPQWVKYQIYQVSWKSMEFQKSSMEFHQTFLAKIKSSMEFHNSMELGSMEKVPWNSMELWIWTQCHGIPWNSMKLQVLLLKFRGIPWNHRCCSNVVQKIPWNSGESSMELFDQNKFQWALKRDFEWMYVLVKIDNHLPPV